MKGRLNLDFSFRSMLGPFALALLFVVGSRCGHASVITSSVEIDLAATTITDDGSGGQLISGGNSTLVPVGSFMPQVGDVLQTTITFAHGDRLRIINGPNIVSDTLGESGPNYFETLVFYFDFAGSGFHITSTTNVVFADLEGSLSDSTPGGVSSGGLNQSLYPNFTDSWISFTGLTLTTTILQLPTGATTYDHFGLLAGRAGGFEIIPGASAAAPEPASMVLFGIGGLSLMALRRRGKHMSLC